MRKCQSFIINSVRIKSLIYEKEEISYDVFISRTTLKRLRICIQDINLDLLLDYSFIKWSVYIKNKIRNPYKLISSNKKSRLSNLKLLKTRIDTIVSIFFKIN